MLLPFPRSLPNGPRLSFTPASLAPRLVMPSKAGIALRLVRLAAKLAHRARAFVCLRQPSYFLFARPRAQERVRTAEPARRAKGGMPGIKRKITEEKGHPAWRLFGIGNRSCVASTPASIPSPALAKRSRHPCRLPLRVSTPTHRRTEAPVEQRAILARTRCATAARLRERAQRQRERPLSARGGHQRGQRIRCLKGRTSPALAK
jgi:hypothetical protein